MHLFRAVLCCSLLFLACIPCSGFLITEFCPDPYLSDDADEYLVISGTGSADGIAISDGESGFRFPKGTIINGKVTVARPATGYFESHGYFPEFEWYGTSLLVPDVISGGKLRMANTRDELMLYQGSTLRQQVSWPSDVKAREGQVHYLDGGVWDRRPLLLGQSRLVPATFTNVTVTAFSSPDSSGEVVRQALASGKESVYVNVYEFTSPVIAESLIDARRRGVDVLVLVEGGPVGGISPEEKTVLSAMNRSGIPVLSMVADGKMKAPYRFDHAKYIIIDERAVLVTSENFKGSGIPPAGYRGNRGWGVICEDPGLAAYYTTVFTSDIRNRYVIPAGYTEGPSEVLPTETYHPEFPARSFSGATVTPVISPDTSYLITELINSAKETIAIEQAYITNESESSLNPYLAAAINASRRGVHVRVLLDSYWYNTGDEKDNDEMAAVINRIAAAENLPIEARCAELKMNNIEKIHNKGVVVDDESVLVSSINWNSNSPNFNREAGVIIHHDGVARYFREIFDDDWSPVVPGTGKAPDMLKYAALLLVLSLLLALYWYRRQHG